MLDKGVLLGQTGDVTTSGNVTTTTTRTSYLLIPGEKVTLQQFVGHKVEVTGMMIPAGESKTETRTKIERDNAPDVTIKEKSKSDIDSAISGHVGQAPCRQLLVTPSESARAPRRIVGLGQTTPAHVYAGRRGRA